MTVSRNNLVSI